MDIPIAKLMIYTLCGGINPYRSLPIMLDVGTDNEELLKDPMYLGWRHTRIHGPAYDSFIEKFVQVLKKKLPHVFLHWEDFGRDNARRILERYRNDICSFNDDMQGTAVVTLSALLAAVRRLDKTISQQRIVIFGAGTAGVGIADQLRDAMVREGLSPDEAQKRFWLVDKAGLITEGMDLMPFQKPYARNKEEVSAWLSEGSEYLKNVVQNVQPTVLIGCSAVSNAFNEEVVRSMYKHCPRPIIFPLSNPNERAEANPADLFKWTDGQVLVATGSPFKDVLWQGKTYQIAQCNNALAFPGIGLGLIASRATRLSDAMLWEACQMLSVFSESADAPLLPPMAMARLAAKAVALRVARQAREEGVSQLPEDIPLDRAVNEAMWQPYYRRIRPKAEEPGLRPRLK